MKPRILFWLENFWPFIGGCEIINMHLIQALQERGYEIMVVTGHPGGSLADFEHYGQIPIHRIEFRKGFMGDLESFRNTLEKVTEIRAEFDPQLVHNHSSLPSILFELKSRRSDSTPTLLTLHTPRLGDQGRDSFFFSYVGNVDHITAVSEHTLCQALAGCNISCGTSVIHNALPVPAGPGPVSLPSGGLIACLSNLVEVKGVDIAIRAFALFAREHPDQRFLVAGDGPEKGKLEKLTEELDIGANVEFTGWIAPETVYAIMDRSSMVVVPSRWAEPFCLVALQAALRARPVVATRVGGLPEVVKDGETGLMVDSENPEQLASSMLKLFENPRLANSLGSKARARALSRFRFNEMVDRYESIYSQLLQGHHVQ